MAIGFEIKITFVGNDGGKFDGGKKYIFDNGGGASLAYGGLVGDVFGGGDGDENMAADFASSDGGSVLTDFTVDLSEEESVIAIATGSGTRFYSQNQLAGLAWGDGKRLVKQDVGVGQRKIRQDKRGRFGGGEVLNGTVVTDSLPGFDRRGESDGRGIVIGDIVGLSDSLIWGQKEFKLGWSEGEIKHNLKLQITNYKLQTITKLQ